MISRRTRIKCRFRTTFSSSVAEPSLRNENLNFFESMSNRPTNSYLEAPNARVFSTWERRKDGVLPLGVVVVGRGVVTSLEGTREEKLPSHKSGATKNLPGWQADLDSSCPGSTVLTKITY